MDITIERREELFKNVDYEKGDIEGLIYQMKNGTYVAIFVSSDGRVNRCQVDYCPWCGKHLKTDRMHTH